MLNKYFKGFKNKSEQRLIQKLTTEAIQIFGVDVYYLPRTLNNPNFILGEDPTSIFESVFKIEAYLESFDGFEGGKNFLTKFGLDLPKQAELLISDSRFKEEMIKGPFNIPKQNIDLNKAETYRPMEGDLIFLPMTQGLFEIKFADHESPDFYQLQTVTKWRLTIQLFKYSNEIINTGIPEIDAIMTQYQNNNDINNDPIADNDTLQLDTDQILIPNTLSGDTFPGSVFE